MADQPSEEQFANSVTAPTNTAAACGLTEFFSEFGLNEPVDFRPMYRQQQAMGIADEYHSGEVKAVRFTGLKVFYDIYSPYHGCMFENVDSAKVVPPGAYDMVPVLDEAAGTLTMQNVPADQVQG